MDLELLKEMKRRDMIKVSRSDSKARFVKRMEVHESDITYKGIEVSKFLINGDLEMHMMVKNYEVIIDLPNARAELVKITTDDDSLNYKHILKYLNSNIDEDDIRVFCTCPDFNYRFSYKATKDGYNAGTPEIRPPSKQVDGLVCKHVLYFLNNKRWLRRFVSEINTLVKLNPYMAGRKRQHT